MPDPSYRAKKALARLAGGLPAFECRARSTATLSANRRAIEHLWSEGYIARGPKPGGPIVTPRGHEWLTRKARLRCDAWDKRQLKTLEALALDLPRVLLAERLGRTVKATTNKLHRIRKGQKSDGKSMEA